MSGSEAKRVLCGLYTDEFSSSVPVGILSRLSLFWLTRLSHTHCIFLSTSSCRFRLASHLPEVRLEMNNDTAWQSGRQARHTLDLLGQELPRSSL